MQITLELLVSAGVALAVGLMLFVFRARAARTTKLERPTYCGPANLSFVCAGCSEQFTHTRRTLGAWERGTRRFYCNVCHKKWRGLQPPQSRQSNEHASVGAEISAERGREQVASRNLSQPSVSHRAAKSGSSSGCLSITVLLIAVPLAVVVATVQYIS